MTTKTVEEVLHSIKTNIYENFDGVMDNNYDVQSEEEARELLESCEDKVTEWVCEEIDRQCIYTQDCEEIVCDYGVTESLLVYKDVFGDTCPTSVESLAGAVLDNEWYQNNKFSELIEEYLEDRNGSDE